MALARVATVGWTGLTPIHSPTMPTSAARIRLSAAPRRAVPAVGIIAITA
jgi:hypothetical protein